MILRSGWLEGCRLDGHYSDGDDVRCCRRRCYTRHRQGRRRGGGVEKECRYRKNWILQVSSSNFFIYFYLHLLFYTYFTYLFTFYYF